MQSYDLTLAAETDLRDIWRYTYKTWGPEQADKYFDQIEACCEAVGDRRARSKALDGLQEGVHIHRCEHPRGRTGGECRDKCQHRKHDRAP